MSMHGRGLKNGLVDEQSKLSSNYLANKLIRGRRHIKYLGISLKGWVRI
jgi:hypothetical protein